MIENELRRRLKQGAELLEALVGDDLANQAVHDAAPAYSGVEFVDMASGQMGVSGGVSQANVDDHRKLRQATIREVATIKRLLATLDSEPERDTRRYPTRQSPSAAAYAKVHFTDAGRSPAVVAGSTLPPLHPAARPPASPR